MFFVGVYYTRTIIPRPEVRFAWPGGYGRTMSCLRCLLHHQQHNKPSCRATLEDEPLNHRTIVLCLRLHHTSEHNKAPRHSEIMLKTMLNVYYIPYYGQIVMPKKSNRVHDMKTSVWLYFLILKSSIENEFSVPNFTTEYHVWLKLIDPQRNEKVISRSNYYLIDLMNFLIRQPIFCCQLPSRH